MCINLLIAAATVSVLNGNTHIELPLTEYVDAVEFNTVINPLGFAPLTQYIFWDFSEERQIIAYKSFPPDVKIALDVGKTMGTMRFWDPTRDVYRKIVFKVYAETLTSFDKELEESNRNLDNNKYRRGLKEKPKVIPVKKYNQDYEDYIPFP